MRLAYLALMAVLLMPSSLAQTSRIRLTMAKGEENVSVLGTLYRRGSEWRARVLRVSLLETEPARGRCRLRFHDQGRERSEWFESGEKKEIFTVRSFPKTVVNVPQVDEDNAVVDLTFPPDRRGRSPWKSLMGEVPVPDTKSLIDLANQGQIKVEWPQALTKDTPEFPASARVSRGRVLLRVVVTKDGRIDPSSLRVPGSAGYGFDRAAIESLLNKWQFKPGTIDGKPSDIAVEIEMTFQRQ